MATFNLRVSRFVVDVLSGTVHVEAESEEEAHAKLAAVLNGEGDDVALAEEVQVAQDRADYDYEYDASDWWRGSDRDDDASPVPYLPLLLTREEATDLCAGHGAPKGIVEQLERHAASGGS